MPYYYRFSLFDTMEETQIVVHKEEYNSIILLHNSVPRLYYNTTNPLILFAC